MLLSQLISILANIVTSIEQFTLLDMVDGEQLVVAMAHVVHPKVDAGLVGGRPYHQVHHGFGDVYVAPLPLTSLLT